jgi:hypothetical protein
MTDIPKIKRNIGKMIDQGAPETDIDAYIEAEGVTLDMLKAQPAVSAGSEAATRSSVAPTPRQVPQTGLNALYQSLVHGKKLTKPAGEASDLIAQGMTFGLADEALAGVRAPLEMLTGRADTLGQGYNQALGQSRENVSAYRERNPVTATGAEVLGGLMTGGTLARGGATLMNTARPTVGNMIARGAGEGALYGGAYGFGTGEGGIENRAIGAAGGGALGALTGGVMGGIAGKMAKSAAGKAVPTTAQIKKVAGDTIEAAKASGVKIPQADFDSAVDDIAKALKGEGFHKALHPRITAPLDELTAAKGTSPTLGDVHILRRIAQNAAMSKEADEARLGHVVIDKIDDLIESTLQGQQLKEGLSLWHRFRKADMIEKAVESAQLRTAATGSGGNVDNAIRQNIKQILEKRSRGFTDAEKALLRKVVEGGPVQNLFRLVGKLSPQGSGLMAALGVGGAMANPAIGAASLAGLAAKPLADRMTMGNVNALSNMIRMGGTPAMPQLTGPQRALIESMIIGGAQQGAEMVPSLMSR